jgi:hypothetical protein
LGGGGGGDLGEGGGGGTRSLATTRRERGVLGLGAGGVISQNVAHARGRLDACCCEKDSGDFISKSVGLKSVCVMVVEEETGLWGRDEAKGSLVAKRASIALTLKSNAVRCGGQSESDIGELYTNENLSELSGRRLGV